MNSAPTEVEEAVGLPVVAWASEGDLKALRTREFGGNSIAIWTHPASSGSFALVRKSDAASEIERLNATIARLQSESAKDGEALKPFARYCEQNDLDERDPDDAIEVPIRDLLAARAALARRASPEQPK